jgi:curved DNA-binding protein CbpA
MGDLYNVLDVPKDADDAAIKAAHRRKAKEHHPDAGGERDEFERVQHAYLVLSNPSRRSRYDATGEWEDEIDNSLSVLVDYIMQAFDMVCSANASRLDYRDMIAETRSLMGQQLADMRQQVEAIRTTKARVEKLLKRLKFSGEGIDPIGNSLRQRSAACDEQATKGEKEIADFTAAIAYLDHYGFDFDQMPTAAGSVFTVQIG